MAAREPELVGADRLREVFARVRDGDARVADLYAEDGVVHTATGSVEGREEIRAFYMATIESIHPRPQVQAVLESPGSQLFAVLVEVETDDGLVHALDLFTVDDDGIRQLEIFHRPQG